MNLLDLFVKVAYDDKDVDKGIDNNKEISGLNHALGELRAELRATTEKMAQKIEELGQAKGNNKKKDDQVEVV